jgi:uncharacterized membrane protein
MGSKEYVLDLLIIIVLSAITVVVVLLLPDGNILRIVLGIPFLLFLPGYSLVSLLWPKMKDIGSVERIGLSFGLSIAVIVIIGLLLNYSPWKLGLVPILISCFGIILLTSIFAWYGRSKVTKEERFFVNIKMRPTKGELSGVDKILVMIIVASLILAGVVLGYVIVMPEEGEKYTEFYILDKNGTTEDYPKDLKVHENSTIIVGIVNHEGSSTSYSLRINLLNRSHVVNITWNFSITINDEEKNEFNFIFNITSSDTYVLEFLLFKGLQMDPYLELHLNEIVVKD